MTNSFQDGFLRADDGTIVTVDTASATAPVGWQDGFLRDATGALVTSGTAGGGGGASAGTVVALGDISGTIVCDLSLGVCFTGTQTGDVTVNFTNWPASPALTEPLLIFNQGTGGFTITIAGVTWEPYGTGPTWDTTAGDVNVIPLSSPDQGSHIYGSTGAAPAVDPIGTLKTSVLFLGYTSASGTWVVNPNTSCLFNGMLTNSSQASGDSVSVPIVLSAGTWTIEALLHKGTVAGIVTVELDGVTLGTWDGYNSVNAFNFVVSFTGVVVSTSGTHTLTLTSTTKNASATAYAIKASQVAFQRTA